MALFDTGAHRVRQQIPQAVLGAVIVVINPWWPNVFVDENFVVRRCICRRVTDQWVTEDWDLALGCIYQLAQVLVTVLRDLPDGLNLTQLLRIELPLLCFFADLFHEGAQLGLLLLLLGIFHDKSNFRRLLRRSLSTSRRPLVG